MNQSRNILASGTTDSVQSISFVVRSSPVAVTTFGTLGSDTGALESLASSGAWVAIHDENGAVLVSATRPQLQISLPGVYRINVTTRTAAWGIDVTPYSAYYSA